MRITALCLCFVALISSISAQSSPANTDSVDYFSIVDTLSIDVVKSADEHLAFVQYRLKPKNTLYSISKYFNVQIGDILKYNPQLTQKMPQLGDILQIPIQIENLNAHATDNQPQLPVYYQVKKGETLYTISKVYFGTSVDDFSQRAGLSTTNLSPDQLLFLGYLNLDQKSDPSTVNSIDSTQRITEHTDRFAQAYEHTDIYSEKGIAFWRASQNNNKIFALHREARVGSMLEVINPMFDTKIYAKVVGRLPKDAYTHDVMTVLSPQAAKILGALDHRFYVKVRYIK